MLICLHLINCFAVWKSNSKQKKRKEKNSNSRECRKQMTNICIIAMILGCNSFMVELDLENANWMVRINFLPIFHVNYISIVRQHAHKKRNGNCRRNSDVFAVQRCKRVNVSRLLLMLLLLFRCVVVVFLFHCSNMYNVTNISIHSQDVFSH